jgi:hypothetical protein
MTKNDWTLFQTKYLVRKLVLKSTTFLVMSFTCHLFYGTYVHSKLPRLNADEIVVNCSVWYISTLMTSKVYFFSSNKVYFRTF